MSDFLKKLEETIGYAENPFDNNQLDVHEVEFPVTEPEPEQVDPTQSIVTTGETSPLGLPREDKTLEDQLDTESVNEVGSLLISIGYILQSNNKISDKYNINEILDFLNHNFSVVGYPTEENPPIETSDDGITPEPQIPIGIDYIQERKLLEESKK